VCYIQAGRRRAQKKMLKVKAEENSSYLNEDDFQLTLDVARALAGRNTPQQVEETPEVANTTETSTEIDENMEIEPRSTGHMTLRPKLRSVRVQLLKYKKSHNPNKIKRLHKDGYKIKKQQKPDNESESVILPRESVTENIESSLRNNILELENIVDGLSCTPDIVIEETTKSSDLEVGEIVKDVMPLEIQLSEIDKEIAGLDEHPLVELDHDDGVPGASGEVEGIQEQLMEISDDEEDDGGIVLLKPEKTDIEILEQQKADVEILEQDFSFDNIDEILSVSLDEGSSELSLW